MLNRRPARHGAARVSGTLSKGRGDARMHRNANNTTTQDDLDPDQFEQDANDRVCIRTGEGMKSTPRGLEVDAGSGLKMERGQLVIDFEGSGLFQRNDRVAQDIRENASAISTVSDAATVGVSYSQAEVNAIVTTVNELTTEITNLKALASSLREFVAKEQR